MTYLPKTITQILKDAYCQRIQQAGLSDEAVAFILGEIFHSKVLKAPKEDSSFVVVAGKYISTIYYSFDNGSVTLTDSEATLVTQSGELIGYGIGITNAFFAIDTSNTRDKLIYRHLGTPKLKLCLSDGKEIDVPFNLTHEGVNRDGVHVNISCDVRLSLRDKNLHNDAGPSIVDLTDEEKRQYFLDGVEHSEKEFRNRAATGPYTFMATE